MSAGYIQNVAFMLGDDAVNIGVRYGHSPVSGDFAVLAITSQISVHVTDATPEALDRLAEAATELAAWRRQQIAAGGES